MFWFRERCGDVEVAFTDRDDGFSAHPYASLNLGSATGDDPTAVARNHAAVARALGVPALRPMAQVHGSTVVVADGPVVDASATVPECDALVTSRAGSALLVRVADCVPVLLADESTGVVGAVHAGRAGMTSGVAARAVEAMRDLGAVDVRAWIGPRACGRCYELPEPMVAEVEAAVAGTRTTTSWGTPAVDVGAGVIRQLTDQGVTVHDVGADVCTIEDDRFYSYRRQGALSGRCGAVVVRR